MRGERPTVADIRLSAIRANFAFAARLAGDREVISVVKADGYGHGAVAVAGALVAAGCSRFAVVTVAEAFTSMPTMNPLRFRMMISTLFFSLSR